MSRSRAAVLATVLLLPLAASPFLPGAGEEDEKDAASRQGEERPAAATADATTAAAADAERARLEEDFRRTLTGATLSGRWRLTEDGALGAEKDEKYTIQSATKVAGDVWIIAARIQYAGKDVTVPVPVKVKWAGDTPVISVTDVGIPGLGTYTARVMVYRGLYTGTWFGPGHGGVLSGTITGEPTSERAVEREGDPGKGSEGGAKE
jgi:hypothetical protein